MLNTVMVMNTAPITNTIDSIRKNKEFQNILRTVNSMVGLKEIKEDMESTVELIYVSKLRESLGLRSVQLNFNSVFMGNPGTGKTTIARLYADFYKCIGILKKGHLVEVIRADLVSNVVGGTALKTRSVFMRSLGGILFIDEAYSLTKTKNDNDFGGESIATLIKLIDDNRDNSIVIVAGYPAEMELFLSSNPGLSSRFTRKFQFQDYSETDLIEIVKSFCVKDDYMLMPNSYLKLKTLFCKIKKKKHFGNGRDARRIYEVLVKNQSHRLVKMRSISSVELSRIVEDDVPADIL